MTDQNFKKRLDDAASLFVRGDECEVMDDYSSHQGTFKAGSSWAVDEIVAWLLSYESKESLRDYLSDYRTYPGPTFWASEIEKRFK